MTIKIGSSIFVVKPNVEKENFSQDICKKNHKYAAFMEEFVIVSEPYLFNFESCFDVLGKNGVEIKRISFKSIGIGVQHGCRIKSFDNECDAKQYLSILNLHKEKIVNSAEYLLYE